AVPGHFLDVEGVRVQDLVRLGDDLLDRGLAHVVVVVLGHRTQVDVHPAQVAALAGDVQDVAGLGVDRAFGAPVREVSIHQHVHHAPGMHRGAPDVLAPDRLPHRTTSTVAAGHIFRPHRALTPVVLAAGLPQGDLHRVLTLVVHLQGGELQAVVGSDAAGAVRGGLGEVVQYARLVHDQMRELADVLRVVLGAGGTHDAPGVLRIRPPEIHIGDVVGLGDDARCEPEGLEGLHAARLDAIGLPEHQTAFAPFHDAGGHRGELRHLRR